MALGDLKSKTSAQSKHEPGPTSAPPEGGKRIRANPWSAVYDQLGNRAFARMLAGGRPTEHQGLEREADGLAARALQGVRADGAAPAPPRDALPNARLPGLGGGQALPLGLARELGAGLGSDLSDVRVHTGPSAAAISRRLGAQAFTSGRDVVFGQGRYDPDSGSGRRLLAHELAHVVQQRAGGAPAVQLQPDVCEAQLPACYGFVAPLECLAPPADVETPIVVESPSVRGEPSSTQTIVLHEPATSSNLTFYAIPRSLVDLGDASTEPVCRSPSTPGTSTAASSDDDRSHPLLASPFTGQSGGRGTIEGVAVPVERVTDAYVIVSQYHHFAVGAGAITLLQTAQGFRLIDAGVGQEGREALTATMMDRISGIVGDQPILEVILSHLHADHTSMMADLAARFPIGKVVVSGTQFADPRFQQLLSDFAEAQVRGVRERAGQQFDAARAQWMEGPGSEIGDVAGRQAAFAAARERSIADAIRQLRATPTTIDLLVPDGGRLHVVSAPIGTVTLPGTTQPGDPVVEGLRLARAPGDVEIGAFTDPASGRRLSELQTAQQTDPNARLEDNIVDETSMNYIIDLPGGNRLMVVPDVRTRSLSRPTRDPRTGTELTNFERALREATGSDAHFTAWNMTHHGQAGWVEGGAPHVVGVGQLVGFIKLMHNLRDIQRSQRPPGGAAPADLITVSAQGDPSSPLVRSLVNPGMVWFLRSLGFEVMLATSGRDIRLIEARTAGGQRIEGVSGLSYEGLRPTDPLLTQSEAALRHLDQKIATESARNARGMSRPAASALVADPNANLQRMQHAHDALEAARNQYLETMSRELWRGPHDTTRPAVAPTPAEGLPPAMAQAEAAVRAGMAAPDLADFTAPTATEAPIVTDTALVLMRLHGDSPIDAQAQRVLDLNQELDVLRARLHNGQDVAATRVELATKLQEMRTLLSEQIESAPGPTRTVYQEELVYTQRELESLTRAGEGDPIFTRDRAGRLVENRIIPIPAERSRATERVLGAAEAAGRVLGGLMVLQTIRSEEQLGERYAAGRANLSEAVVGGISSAYGVTIGLRMMTGIPVSPYEFVVMSALDITQTLCADYASPEQRAVAISQSVLSNSISLALMVIGQALMEAGAATANPWLVAAGFAIMFLTKPIMMLLEAAGLFAAIERWTAFLPSEVTGANQHLRDLMAEYHAIIGALAISARSDAELHALGGSNPAAVRTAASTDVGEARRHIHDKESELMAAFSEAYTRASRDYAGLFELDTMRDQFLQLRRQAHEGEGSEAAARSRDQALSGFERIDRDISLDALSPEDVRDMPQWREINHAINHLYITVGQGDDTDWTDVRDEERNIEQMLRNARYRIHPEEFGTMRSTPLLGPSSPARAAYEYQLGYCEDSMRRLRLHLTGTATGVWTGYVSDDRGAAGEAQALLSAYSHLIDNPPARPFAADAAFRHSMDAGPVYRSYVRDHDDYAHYLLRLQSTEMALRSGLASAAHDAAPDEVTRLRQLSARIESESSRRAQQLGLLYLDELDEIFGRVRQGETEQIVHMLGGEAVTPLSADEQAAIGRGELEDVAGQLTTVSNRLARVNGLRIPDSPDGVVEGVYRVEGDIDEIDLFIIGIPGAPVTREENVLVGVVGTGHEVVTGYGHDMSIPVTPLNAAAVVRLGGTGTRSLNNRFLQPATLADLRRR